MPDRADEDSNFDSEEAVRVIRTNTISKKSRDVYYGSIAQMLHVSTQFSRRYYCGNRSASAHFNLANTCSYWQNVNDVVPQLQKVAPDVIRGVIEEIEKRATTAALTLKNSPTPGIQQEETLTGDEAVTTTSLWGSHTWGGSLHHVPQDFAFPNSCSQIAWQYWMCGDRQKRYPPLRNLSRDDMQSTNMRKRLSDLRYLMQFVEKRVEEQGKWIANPSIEQANEMFEAGKDVLDISDVSEKGRKRLRLQMKWTSMVTRVETKGKARGLRQYLTSSRSTCNTLKRRGKK
ncbi:hypothetical protein IV203_001981 [Nitzschia inconspicua]|uniref:Uncharacterized protein n=1 Tax=Nitzschia inconspicua TaxID=303405 RepID=A0A9K3L8D7_9STRA|nr:hypothetical protein IV203_001981 [Nitzschia inconspicua]